MRWRTANILASVHGTLAAPQPAGHWAPPPLSAPLLCTHTPHNVGPRSIGFAWDFSAVRIPGPAPDLLGQPLRSNKSHLVREAHPLPCPARPAIILPFSLLLMVSSPSTAVSLGSLLCSAYCNCGAPAAPGTEGAPRASLPDLLLIESPLCANHRARCFSSIICTTILPAGYYYPISQMGKAGSQRSKRTETAELWLNTREPCESKPGLLVLPPHLVSSPREWVPWPHPPVQLHLPGADPHLENLSDWWEMMLRWREAGECVPLTQALFLRASPSQPTPATRFPSPWLLSGVPWFAPFKLSSWGWVIPWWILTCSLETGAVFGETELPQSKYWWLLRAPRRCLLFRQTLLFSKKRESERVKLTPSLLITQGEKQGQ